MTLLEGDIRSLFGSVFSTIYDDGTMTTIAMTDDGQGGIVKTPTTQACKVQRDDLTEIQRLELGYAPSDVRLLVLRQGLSAPVTTGDTITVYSQTYTVGPAVSTDPGNSHWVIRGVKN